MSENRKRTMETRIRLEPELHARLKEQADKDKRTITAQVEWYVEQALLEEEKRQENGYQGGDTCAEAEAE